MKISEEILRLSYEEPKETIRRVLELPDSKDKGQGPGLAIKQN